MNIWKTSAVAAALLTGTTLFAQQSRIVYDNTQITQDKQFAVTSDALEVGDEVTLAHYTSGTITRFQFEYFLTGGSGNETAQLTLRQMAPNGEPGDVIFQTTPFGIGTSAFPLQADLDLEGFGADFNSPNLLWSIRFGGLEGNEQAGLLFYLGPQTGSSMSDFWLAGSSGWARASNPEVSGNFSARITAVPEPGTWALLVGGLGFLGYFGYRRRTS